MRDHGGKSLPDRPAEAGYFQVLWLGECFGLPRRGDHPPDEAAAYLSSLAFPWGDWQIGHRLPAPSPLSPAVLQALTTSGGSFIDGGVKSDSPPSRLAWQLYRLLVRSCWPTRWWLTERRCHLRSVQRRCGRHLSPLGQTPWTLCQLCPSVPFCSSPNLYGPPYAR